MIEGLERLVKEGKVQRTEVMSLKGGTGKVIIYKDNRKYPNSAARVYESGWIVLAPGATIGLHQHTNDEESYTLLEGMVECNNQILAPEETSNCSIGEQHYCKNLSKEKSIIRFLKTKK